MRPRFSVIVPAYNEEKTIARTLRSLLKQTYRDMEIIVVDNNSSDNTAAIARALVTRVYVEKKRLPPCGQPRHFARSRADIRCVRR